MDLSTGKWFKYLNEEILTEGLKDIGLPESVVTHFEAALMDAPEKAKTWLGHEWKKTHLFDVAQPQPVAFGVLSHMLNNFGDIDPEGQTFKFISWLTKTMPRHDVDYLEHALKEPTKKIFHARAEDRYGEKEPQLTGDELVKLFKDRYVTNANPLQFHGQELWKSPENSWVLRKATPEKFREFFLMSDIDMSQADRWDRIKFIILNLRNTIIEKPFGKWGKAFKKAIRALGKLELDKDKVESVAATLNNTMAIALTRFNRRYDEIYTLLNQNPSNFDMVKGLDLDAALRVAEEYMANLEDPDLIIHTFNDGSYWYNLDTSTCTVEAQRMGHCGSDHRGTLVSLRKKDSKKRESKSYVTITYSPDHKTIYQIKGRSNEAPPESVWGHIDWFIKNMDVKNVEETGEHSTDADGIMEMTEYLRDANPRVAFHGGIETAMDYIQQELSTLNENADDINDSNCCTVHAEAEEYNGHIEVNTHAEISLQIPLTGWEGFEEDSDGDFVATIGPNSGTPDERFHLIPAGGYSSNQHAFLAGPLEAVEELSDSGEVVWDVEMLEGPVPDGSDATEGPKKVYMNITFMRSQQDVVWQGGAVENISLYDVEAFFDEIEENISGRHDELVDTIRRELVKDGYIAKSDWDRGSAELAKFGEDGLENFSIHSLDSGTSFWFRDGRGSDIETSSEIQFSKDVHLYLYDGRNVLGGFPIYVQRAFGGLERDHRGHRTVFKSSEMTADFLAALTTAVGAASAVSQDQQQLPFGDKYKHKPQQVNIQDVVDFFVVSNIKYTSPYRPGSNQDDHPIPDMEMKWKFGLFAGTETTAQQFEDIKKWIVYFNDNPEVVKAAANATVSGRIEEINAHALKTKEDIDNGNTASKLLTKIDSIYGAESAAGTSDIAERIVIIARWIKNNFDEMTEVQKYVAVQTYLRKMAAAMFRIHANEGAIDDDGKPVMFNQLVTDELSRWGAVPPEHRTNESVEEQILRIERKLTESADVRLYKLAVSATVAADRAGHLKLLTDEIRGIPGVTTVTREEKTVAPHGSQRIILNLKFELLGQQPRERYVLQQLLPAMNRITGLKVGGARGIDWTVPQDVTPGGTKSIYEAFGDIKEYYVNDPYTQDRPTPKVSLDSIATDWAQGGVQVYDTPVNTNSMRYHTMIEVEELMPYTSHEFRATSDVFRGGYEKFIRDGAMMPVYVAVGENGVKITGNEDLVWYADKAGQRELPVFLSYQKQV